MWLDGDAILFALSFLAINAVCEFDERNLDRCNQRPLERVHIRMRCPPDVRGARSPPPEQGVTTSNTSALKKVDGSPPISPKDGHDTLSRIVDLSACYLFAWARPLVGDE